MRWFLVNFSWLYTWSFKKYSIYENTFVLVITNYGTDFGRFLMCKICKYYLNVVGHDITKPARCRSIFDDVMSIIIRQEIFADDLCKDNRPINGLVVKWFCIFISAVSPRGGGDNIVQNGNTESPCGRR